VNDLAEPEALVINAANFDVRTHNGCVTITSAKSGEHRTFKVSTVQGGNLEGKRIASLLVGPDNGSDYQGFGFVDDRGVRPWNRFRDDHAYAVFAKMLNEPARYMAFGHKYQVEGHCRRCNKLLTHPDSIASGLGPVCALK
jgi:hypothetical protein